MLIILAVVVYGGLHSLLAGVLQTDAFSFIGFRLLFQPTPSLTHDEGPLVTRGFYRWVRHPLYTCGLLFIWLSPVMTQNFLILYLCLTLYIVVGANLEERKLIRRFGQAYLDYRSHTPMFIPVVELLFHK
jgi:protein-S-isoprenylcysteine O-methyltransferase Ste14